MFTINESSVQRWIEEGAAGAVRAALADPRGQSLALQKAIASAVSAAEPQISLAVSLAIAQACASTEFGDAVKAEIGRAFANKFRGAFDAVITSVARRAADDQLIADRMASFASHVAATTGAPLPPQDARSA